jgi:D-glycero-D-manno-heptose 1,7-bisphosphate phosphatase
MLVLVQTFVEVRTSTASGPARVDRSSMVRPLAFVDRDGVINANRTDHVKSWDEFVFLPGALDALALLSRSGWRVVVVTNQAVVNRGLVSTLELEQLHARMAEEIRHHGGQLSAVYACPHRPDEGCGCRKPEPGLLVAAAANLAGRLDRSVMVGDHLTDLEAAKRAGCKSILVLSGRHQFSSAQILPENCVAIVSDLLAAVQHVVGDKSWPSSNAGTDEDSEIC